MIFFGERCHSNPYDEISDDEFSDDEVSGFANTTKFPTTKFPTTKFPPPLYSLLPSFILQSSQFCENLTFLLVETFVLKSFTVEVFIFILLHLR